MNRYIFQSFLIIKRMLDKAVICGKRGYNPAQKVEISKFKKKDIQFYDDKQTKILLTYLEDEDIKCKTIIKIGIYTDMRKCTPNGIFRAKNSTCYILANA